MEKDLDVTKINDKSLLLKHAILHRWFKRGKKSWSKEDIWNLHKRITNEMKERGIKHIIKDKLDRIKIKVKKKEVNNFIEDLNDAVILKDAVSLVGSFVEKEKYNDIDILIRLDSLDYIKRAIMTRIDKMTGEDKNLHFTFESEGPHDTFIPLFDLMLKKSDTRLIEMEEHWDINLPPTFDFIIDFAEILKKIKGNSILDLGCGAGHAMKTFNRMGFETFGLDMSDKAIKHCKKLNLDVKKFNLDKKLDFENNQFDTIVSMHVLEHLKDPTKLIEESIRVAKKAVIHVIPLKKRVPKEHKRIYYKRDAKMIAKRYGFKYKIYKNGLNLQKENAILWKYAKNLEELEALVFQKPAYRLYESKEIFDLKGYDKSVVQVKFDGESTVITNKKRTVRILPEDTKRDKSKFLPKISNFIKKFPNCILHVELVGIQNGVPLHRTEITGYLNSKKYDARRENLVHAFIVDIFKYKDKILTKLPLSQRMKFLNKLKSGPKVHVLGTKKPMGEIVFKQSIPKAIERVMKNKFAEGVMIKDLKAPVTRQNKGMAKLKKWYEFDGRVLEKIRNKAGNWNYIIGTEISKDYASLIGKKAIEKFGKYYMRLCKTMNTNLNVNEKAILRLRIQEVHKDFIKNKPVYSLFLPRVHSDQSKIRAKEDGLTTLENLFKKTKKKLIELAKMDGLILVTPHGKMIWEGTKKLIVKSKKFNIAGKFFYLIEKNKCYGIIKITTVEKMDEKLFDELHYLHKISKEEKEKWWPEKKEFWGYQFKLIIRYVPPKKVKIPVGPQVFVKAPHIEMLQEDEEKWKKYQIKGPKDKSIRDWPDWIQKDLIHVMKKKLKPRFVMQHHERGKSLHTDLRMDIPHKGYLIGFSIANPASVTNRDRINNKARNVLVVEVKPRIPKEWLKVEGIHKKGEPGATRRLPGIFTIVAKGTYEIWHVDDHKIGIIFHCDKGKIHKVKGRLRKEEANLKQLTGKFSVTIAHIRKNRWVGYFSHLKGKATEELIESLLEDILMLSKKPEIHKVLFQSPIKEELGKKFKMPYEFDFIALKEGEFNGVWYSKEELKKAFHTLLNKDITIDHGKGVRDIVGKIKNVWWNNHLEQIEGTGIVKDKEIAKKIHDRLITGVSVEVYVEYDKTEHGLTAKNPTFVALSLVSKPACKTCRIVPNL